MQPARTAFADPCCPDKLTALRRLPARSRPNLGFLKAAVELKGSKVRGRGEADKQRYGCANTKIMISSYSRWDQRNDFRIGREGGKRRKRFKNKHGGGLICEPIKRWPRKKSIYIRDHGIAENKW